MYGRDAYGVAPYGAEEVVQVLADRTAAIASEGADALGSALAATIVSAAIANVAAEASAGGSAAAAVRIAALLLAAAAEASGTAGATTRIAGDATTTRAIEASASASATLPIVGAIAAIGAAAEGAAEMAMGGIAPLTMEVSGVGAETFGTSAATLGVYPRFAAIAAVADDSIVAGTADMLLGGFVEEQHPLDTQGGSASPAEKKDRKKRRYGERLPLSVLLERMRARLIVRSGDETTPPEEQENRPTPPTVPIEAIEPPAAETPSGTPPRVDEIPPVSVSRTDDSEKDAAPSTTTIPTRADDVRPAAAVAEAGAVPAAPRPPGAETPAPLPQGTTPATPLVTRAEVDTTGADTTIDAVAPPVPDRLPIDASETTPRREPPDVPPLTSQALAPIAPLQPPSRSATVAPTPSTASIAAADALIAEVSAVSSSYDGDDELLALVATYYYAYASY